MRDLANAMATFMKKFKRKRRLSTELHSRWGDVSITYPTEGSWNQWDQPSGLVANAPQRALPTAQHDQGQRHVSAGSVHGQSPGSSIRRSRSTGPECPPSSSSPSFPTGHFNQNIRHRDPEERRPFQGLGIADLRRDSTHASSIINDDSSSSSCDEDDEYRDVLGPVGLSPRIYELGDTSHTRDNTEDYDIPAKSPPLSVTSRMRRCSVQSCATEPVASLSGTNSRRTSYTAASSISAPSMPPSTPRYAQHTPKPLFTEKRYPPRPATREPEPATRQEMVPSYDELYG
ncbi:unnamed protein product [Penicillium olsonii]|nr:unnamed protein product [Penicillium olsonii]CAG7930298.1 unnamed protein product [Penicillium olsonii]